LRMLKVVSGGQVFYEMLLSVHEAMYEEEAGEGEDRQRETS